MTGDPQLDELLRDVDRLCAARDWAGLLALRSRARAAYERGRQHWPAAEYAEYRLALEAPGEFAAAVIVEGAGRFALGPLTDVDEARALRGLAATWLAESSGGASAVAVQGPARRAIAALGITTARIASLGPGQAFAAMAWAGASGGANGRRRGMAWGRYLAWECASILLQVDMGDVGDAVDELAWFAWDAVEPDTGWPLRLAIEDPLNDCAWAVAATDRA